MNPTLYGSLTYLIICITISNIFAFSKKSKLKIEKQAEN